MYILRQAASVWNTHARAALLSQRQRGQDKLKMALVCLLRLDTGLNSFGAFARRGPREAKPRAAGVRSPATFLVFKTTVGGGSSTRREKGKKQKQKNNENKKIPHHLNVPNQRRHSFHLGRNF